MSSLSRRALTALLVGPARRVLLDVDQALGLRVASEPEVTEVTAEELPVQAAQSHEAGRTAAPTRQVTQAARGVGSPPAEASRQPVVAKDAGAAPVVLPRLKLRPSAPAPTTAASAAASSPPTLPRITLSPRPARSAVAPGESALSLAEGAQGNPHPSPLPEGSEAPREGTSRKAVGAATPVPPVSRPEAPVSVSPPAATAPAPASAPPPAATAPAPASAPPPAATAPAPASAPPPAATAPALVSMSPPAATAPRPVSVARPAGVPLVSAPAPAPVSEPPLAPARRGTWEDLQPPLPERLAAPLSQPLAPEALAPAAAPAPRAPEAATAGVPLVPTRQAPVSRSSPLTLTSPQTLPTPSPSRPPAPRNHSPLPESHLLEEPLTSTISSAEHTGLDRESLAEALTDILREAVRREGLEV